MAKTTRRQTMRPCNNVNGEFSGYLVDCPGCGEAHFIRTVAAKDYPVWSFDGNMDTPTFEPSVRSRWPAQKEGGPERVCHFVLQNGVFKFFEDCTHEHRGKQIPFKL